MAVCGPSFPQITVLSAMDGIIARRLRLTLVTACLAAMLPLAPRLSEVLAEVSQDRVAAAAFQRGVVLLNSGRFDEAAGAFRVAVAYAPKNTEAYLRLSEAEFKQGRIDEAIAAYRGLMAIYPFTYESFLYWQLATIEISAGRLAEARDDLLHAVALDPTEWRPYYFLGIVYVRMRDVTSARDSWRRVLSLDPKNGAAYEQLRNLDAPRP